MFVDAGDGERLHVWCGAFNMEAGDVVPLATIGTTMPDGRAIGKRKILGIASEGMLCSAAELGLGDDHSGILILPPETPLGRPIYEALGVREDVVFDLDITRNRPDAYGHLGVARDLAAQLGVPFHPPSPELHATGSERSAPVTIVDPDRCGRFVSLVLSGRRGGAVGTVDGGAAQAGRHAPHQQRGRRVQLRHAGAERAATTPTTWPAWGRRVPHPARRCPGRPW